MSLKFNGGDGAGICDECLIMLWSGVKPYHRKLVPYNHYCNGSMYCKKCDPYLKKGLARDVVDRYDGASETS